MVANTTVLSDGGPTGRISPSWRRAGISDDFSTGGATLTSTSGFGLRVVSLLRCVGRKAPPGSLRFRAQRRKERQKPLRTTAWSSDLVGYCIPGVNYRSRRGGKKCRLQSTQTRAHPPSGDAA